MVMVTMRMSIHAWIVGKVEAPAKAKRIELNAGKWSLRDWWWWSWWYRWWWWSWWWHWWHLFQNQWNSKDSDGSPPTLDEERLVPATWWHSEIWNFSNSIFNIRNTSCVWNILIIWKLLVFENILNTCCVWNTLKEPYNSSCFHLPRQDLLSPK